MALEFPNSPTLNEEYPYQGVMYIWDGVKWTSKGTTSGLPIYPDADGNVVITGDIQAHTFFGVAAEISDTVNVEGDLSVAGDIDND